MPPQTSRSRKRKRPVHTSDEDEGVTAQGSVTANSDMGRSRGVGVSTPPRQCFDRTDIPQIVSTPTSASTKGDGQKTGRTVIPAKRGVQSRRIDGSIETPPRCRVDEGVTPGIVSTPTSTRAKRDGRRTGTMGAARTQARREQRPEMTSRRKGLGDDERKPGTGSKSASGVERTGVVPALPRGRFKGPGTSAGTAQREKGVGGSKLQGERSESRQGAQHGVQQSAMTSDDSLHLQTLSRPSRTVHSATPAGAPSTVRSKRGRGSEQPPQNTAFLTVEAPQAVGAGSSRGFTLSRTPSPDPTNSGPNCSSHNAASSSTVTNIGTNHYPGAHDFSIREQHFTTNNIGSSKTLFDYLDPHVAHGAAHNSHDRRDAPACHKETRVAIREHVVGWIEHEPGEDEAREIMWLSGPAGSGKSAIAGSVAETCKEEGILAATFFFSSFSPSKDRCWSRALIATLIHHMSQHRALDAFRQQLLLALEECPDIFHKQLREQAEHLILEPFREIHEEGQGRVGWPKAVIVDGIDEIIARRDRDEDVRQQSEDDQVEVVEVLFALAQNPYFPFRIFVASRPERNITDFFNEPTIHPFTVPLFLDSKYKPDADIERFLSSKFAQIRRRFRLSDASWPGQGAVDHIVEMSSGQFIVPTTVIRWIESGMPKQQLDEVLNLQRDNMASKNPFESLDALYHHILMRARTPDGDARLVVRWIKTINSSVSPSRFGLNKPPTATFWRSFLEDEEGEFDYRMAPISSLISIPPPDDTESPITFYHKSLIDYLSNHTRCGDLYVGGQEEVNSFVSARIVVVLKYMGPRVPSQRLDEFLSRLQELNAFETPAYFLENHNPLLQQVATFLRHLGGKDLDTLTSCNAAWWARLLTQQRGIHVDLSSFVRAIYFGIHKASKCIDLPGREDLSARQAAQEEEKPGCHPACVHWRTGILAEVRRLGWCMHRLQAIPLHKLQDVSMNWADDVLGKAAHEGCRVCTPMLEHPAFYVWNEGRDAALGVSYDVRLGWYVPL